MPSGIADLNNAVAAFQLIRGPHAFLGWSWVSCSGDCFTTLDQCPPPPGHQVKYDRSLGGLVGSGVDYGEPVEVCRETAPGSEIFTRRWTKSVVTFDCKRWTSRIKMLASE